MKFLDKLNQAMDKNSSLLCIGLDPTVNSSLFEFNKQIIDQTHDLVCAYKPNSAFYEAKGSKGIEELKLTMEYLTKKYPEIPIILDAKRGDIGNSNQAYAGYCFNYLKCDAVTLHPYLGLGSLQPFLDYKDKGIIILCKTSNKEAGEFQNLKIKNEELWQVVAKKTKKLSSQVMLVVGATYPKELSQVRYLVSEMTLLVPGIGAQGGDLQATMKAGLNTQKKGLVINSSRGIINASNPRSAAKELRNKINQYR